MISLRLKNEALNIRGAIAVNYYFCCRTRCCLRSVLSGYYNMATNERLPMTICGCLWEACGDFRYAWMSCGSVQRFRYAVRMKHLTFRSAMAVSHYFCFWTTCCQRIKDTLAKFENAVLVDVYHSLCVYRYFSRLLLENEAFLRSIGLPVFIEVFILSSRSDSSNSQVDFSSNGS